MVGQRAKAVVLGGIGEQPIDEIEFVVVELSAGLDAPHGRSG